MASATADSLRTGTESMSGLRRRSLSSRRWHDGVIAIGLVVLSAMLWLPYLNHALNADTASYAVAAYWWARGDGLYRQIIIPLPQGVLVIFRLIESIGLGSVQGIRLAAAGYNLVTGVVLYAIANRLYGRGIGAGAAALFTLFMGVPYLEGTSANAELFMLLPLLGSLYFLLRADDAPLGAARNLRDLGFAGLLAAAALVIKPSGLAGLALALFWLLSRYKKETASHRALVAAVGALGASFTLGLFPAVFHGLVTASDTYLTAILLYRLAQDSISGTPIGDQLMRFAVVSVNIIVRLPIVLMGVWCFVGNPRVPSRREPRARRLLGLWLLTSLGGVAMGGSWWGHNYQQLAPPLAVAASVGVSTTLRRPRDARQTATQGLAVAAMLLLAWAIGAVVLAPNHRALDTLKRSQSVATYLRDHTGPADRIYVVYQAPEIYYLAERRPAATRLDARQLKRSPGAFTHQVARLADPATAPAYIVGVQPFDEDGFDRDGQLRAVVARYYELEATIDGIPLYRRKGL